MIGSTISHYQIIAQIGAGGMGVVYEAEDLILKRRVAIKTLKDPGTKVARLLREARAISRIAHPHIATIYDYGETENGRPFIVMELVKGIRFDEWTSETRPELSKIVDVMTDIVDGISAAHLRHIIHRDIKPSNVLIDQNGTVKVLDFGLSKQLKEYISESDGESDLTQTQNGMVVGTPLYLSPEQAKSEETDERSDIFSLGTLFYEAITGKSPFYSESVFETCAKILRDEPVPPSGVNRDIPKAFDRVVQKALAKDPAKRYQTAQEFLADLKELQKDPSDVVVEKTEAKPASRVSISQRLQTSFRDVIRYPYVSALVFLIAAVVGVGFFLLLGGSNRQYQPNQTALFSYERGERAFNDGLYFSASQNFEAATKADTSFAMAFVRYAEALEQLGFIGLAQFQREKANILVSSDQALSATDTLRFQAINNILRSDFESALQDYQRLVDEAKGDGKQRLLIDLARTYERIQNPDKAIETYQKSLEYMPDLPVAHLRLAVLYGRRLNNVASEVHFHKATDGYRLLGNSEGSLEVAYQKALMISNTRDAKPLIPEIERSLLKAEINEVPYQHIKGLILMSRILRSVSEQKRSMPYVEQAITLAVAENVEDLHIQAMLERGTVNMVLGKLSESKGDYEEAIKLAQDYKSILGEKRGIFQLGALAVYQHNSKEALQRIGQVEEFFENGGYQRDMMDIITIKAQAYKADGNFKKALDEYNNLLQRANKGDDLIQKARALKGIADLHVNQDHLSDALGPMMEGYAVYNSMNKKFEASHHLAAYADTMIQLGRYDEANVALNQAEGLAGDNKNLLLRIQLIRAREAMSQERFADAVRMAEIAAGSETKEIKIESSLILGLAKTRMGQPPEGLKVITTVLPDAINQDDQRISAYAYLVSAEVMFENGKYYEALKNASTAREMYERSEKTSLEWRAWLMIGKAQRALNMDNKEAAGNADAVFSRMSQKNSTEDFDRYSKRPDVEFYRRSLVELSVMR